MEEEIRESNSLPPRYFDLTVSLDGEGLAEGDTTFLAIWNGQIILEQKWQKGLVLTSHELSVDLNDTITIDFLADIPLVLLMRVNLGKGGKEMDPLQNIDNRAGGNVDFLPLILGEERIETTVNLVYIATKENTGCIAEVCINAGPGKEERAPLLLTMISAKCLPQMKEGTVYPISIGLDGVLNAKSVPFGASSNVFGKKYLIWASISALGYAAESKYSVPNDDQYIPSTVEILFSEDCRSEQWYFCKRVLVNEQKLRNRLHYPFFVDMAGVTMTGKFELRCRYMAFVDAAVLLEPGETGATICTKLYYYNELGLPDNVSPLLELPPSSAKPVVRENDDVVDEFGHITYITIKFNLHAPLVPKIKTVSLFELIGIKKAEGSLIPVDVMHVLPPPEDYTIDVRKIRKESGAQAIHYELSNMACSGALVMNQSIKKTAANRLLMRIKYMLKQFPPGKCSNIDWQDIVAAQHSAARRAVTASFAPQPPPTYEPTLLSAARSRITGDTKLANILTEITLKNNTDHPRYFLINALRCLEQSAQTKAYEYLEKGLNLQPINKYFLWAFGAQEYLRGPNGMVRATAIFQIAARSNSSDGTSNAIGWGALHALYHYENKSYAAFIAARNMRKCYTLSKDWKGFLQRWTNISGEEESLWNPNTLDTSNPLVITSAFFLCLRAYNFSDLLLSCCEGGCASRGAKHLIIKSKVPDISYLRAASFLLRGEVDNALKESEAGICKYGPSPKLSQMKATCLLFANGWDGRSEGAFKETERAGAESSPILLLRAALGGIKTNPRAALQRAARAHKATPCAYSALVLGRVYLHLDEEELAENWVSAAVKQEPLLADGWAFLAILAIRKNDVLKARSLLRTAQQLGHISEDILQQLQYLKSVFQVESLPESLMNDLCLCNLYNF